MVPQQLSRTLPAEAGGEAAVGAGLGPAGEGSCEQELALELVWGQLVEAPAAGAATRAPLPPGDSRSKDVIMLQQLQEHSSGLPNPAERVPLRGSRS